MDCITYEVQVTLVYDFWITQNIWGSYFIDLLGQEHRLDYPAFKTIIYN
jgi:hypothetical protein